MVKYSFCNTTLLEFKNRSVVLLVILSKLTNIKTLKKRSIFILVFIQIVVLNSCIINNPKPEDCVVETVKITKITEGPYYDIVFHDDGTDYFYINRGLEYGLNLDSLNAKVLNKTVTLHLAKIMGGITSEHISQLVVGN